jgi:protein TonB
VGIALAGTCLAVALALCAPQVQEPPVAKLPVDDTPIVTMTDVPEQTPAKKPEPPQPVTHAVVRPVAPRPLAQPQPSLDRVPTPAPEPVKEVVKEVLAPTPQAQETPTPQKVASAAPHSADIESGYVARLRGYIRSITEYPTSGDARRQRPEGASVVRFVLTRTGIVSGVEIERSSGSKILDKQAMSIVSGGSYPPMPTDAWVGAAEHLFSVTVQFIAP